MSILVIFAHPDVEQGSIGNRVVLDELKHCDGIEIRELYTLYPDFSIDIAAEQAALCRAEVIVLQFPLFWYSVPSLLKEWFDAVLTHGFAYGSSGDQLKGKKLLLSFTIGGPEESYSPSGYNTYPVDAFMPPFRQTAKLCGMEFVDDYIFSHGVLNIPGIEYPRETTEAIALQHARRLIERLGVKPSDRMEIDAA